MRITDKIPTLSRCEGHCWKGPLTSIIALMIPLGWNYLSLLFLFVYSSSFIVSLQLFIFICMSSYSSSCFVQLFLFHCIAAFRQNFQKNLFCSFAAFFKIFKDCLAVLLLFVKISKIVSQFYCFLLKNSSKIVSQFCCFLLKKSSFLSKILLKHRFEFTLGVFLKDCFYW